jgi:hypothetical protein
LSPTFHRRRGRGAVVPTPIVPESPFATDNAAEKGSAEREGGKELVSNDEGAGGRELDGAAASGADSRGSEEDVTPVAENKKDESKDVGLGIPVSFLLECGFDMMFFFVLVIVVVLISTPYSSSVDYDYEKCLGVMNDCSAVIEKQELLWKSLESKTDDGIAV